MSKKRHRYKYKIKVGNKVIFRGLDKRLINYLIAKNPNATVGW